MVPNFDALANAPRTKAWLGRVQQLKSWAPYHRVMGFAVKKFNPSRAGAQVAASAAAATAADAGFKSAAVFKQIEDKLKTDGAQFVQKIGAVYAFKLTNASDKQQTWLVDLKSGSGSVRVGSGDGDCKADTTLSLKDDDFIAMNAGKLDSQMAFMQGKLKIAGNMAHAMKLNMLLSQIAKL
eukprot:TRINITY_DN1740_c0_g2_i5.p2 TRINITY_DN1740_c0_g2~~TRINITY_DN1740_c0_g2_i5.p2  ORF type:complete len:181 (+),score=62.41 TRINITY_DN1740_c0_g2_i5:340-882(+)